MQIVFNFHNFFFRKNINSDHAPEILFSEDYYPQIVQFLTDEHVKLTHLKFNFVLTVIYESPVVENNEDEGKLKKSSHDSFRKGRYIFILKGNIFSQFFGLIAT